MIFTKSSILSSLICISIIIGVLGDESDNIVGGIKVELGALPYQVSLRVGNQHFCGGSLISNQHVLTASHCLFDKHAYMVIVYTSTIDVKSGIPHRVKRLKLHSGFTFSPEARLPNDVAVITLEQPIELNQYQNVIKLPTSAFNVTKVGIASGWGSTTSQAIQINKELLKLETYVLNPQECQKYFYGPLYTTQLCEMSFRNAGTCQGDSGGPLVVDGEIVGIVSYGFICASLKPDVFTAVYHYLQFIEDAMHETDDSENGLSGGNAPGYPSYPSYPSYPYPSRNSYPYPTRNSDPWPYPATQPARNNAPSYMYYNGRWYPVSYPYYY